MFLVYFFIAKNSVIFKSEINEVKAKKEIILECSKILCGELKFGQYELLMSAHYAGNK